MTRSSSFFLRFCLTLALLGWVSPLAAQSPWQETPESDIAIRGTRTVAPDVFRPLSLDVSAMEASLAAAPLEGGRGGLQLELPFPDGRSIAFTVWESPVMAPELAAKYPEIKTYRASGTHEPHLSARLDMTPAGFHAMIFTEGEVVFIDPYQFDDRQHYLAYFKSDLPNPGKDFSCGSAQLERVAPTIEVPDKLTPVGGELLTYRAAFACTGEYAAFHGGSVPAALAAIVTSVNRVNAIYERDFSIRMELVANNDAVIFTNAGSDPYANNSGGAMLSQNISTLNSIIGSNNYDIGHVFSTGGGGVAYLGSVCGGFKAGGVTGLPNPVGDPFDIDYVSHEVGHQFGAEHTFNGTTSSCGFGNRSGGSAYEPGSGSTIMAYAGICGSENIQLNSDAYFHARSYAQVVAFSRGSGACAATSPVSNTPPVISAGADYTIPRGTPFTLTASGSDAESAGLTYTWEQYNLGAASPPNTDNGNRPIFRSFAPSSNPARTFPQWSDILNNSSTLGETLPTTDRTLAFRVTGRDNQSGGGGVNLDDTAVRVVTSAGPFLVSSPNTNVTWMGGTSQTVTWDVAGTSAAPVNASGVDILLSIDGGNSFPIVLADNTPNDGSHTIQAPVIGATNQARLMVRASGNIFFDVSNRNFTIEPPPEGADSVSVWVSDSLAARVDEAVVVPVIIGEVLVSHHVNSFELELTYEDSHLTFDDLSLAGTVISGWSTVAFNEPEPGRILVNGANTAGAELVVDQDSLFLNLSFTVKSDAPVACAPLTLTPDRLVFNAGLPEAEIFNGQFCVEPTPPPQSDLSLSMDISPESAPDGSQVTVTLTAVNSGPDTAGNVTVSAPLVSGLTYVSDNGGGSYSNNIWTIGSMPTGSQTLAITATFSAPDEIVNTAEIRSSDSVDQDSSPNNNNPEEDDYAAAAVHPPSADISLTNRVSNLAPFLGDPFTFTLTLTNGGPDMAEALEVNAPLPADITLIPDENLGSTYSNGVWTVSSLAANQSEVLVLTVRGETPGLKTFTAELAASSVPDPDSTPNNSSSDEDDISVARVTPRAVQGAIITITNDDGPGEGLNDSTPAAPVGGNTGTTLGEQRMLAFLHVASIWGSFLVSDLEIQVSAQFNPMTCTPEDPLLAFGEPFTWALVTNGLEDTWYPLALANNLDNDDLNDEEPEISIIANSDITSNNTCSNGADWYYGLDGEAGGRVDLVTVLVKEMARGLGFATLIDQNGRLSFNRSDIFMTFLEDHGTGKTWPEMTNQERVSSAGNPNTLHWVGPSAMAAGTEILNEGIHSSGHLEMQAGASTLEDEMQMFFNTSHNPNTVMEPGYSQVNHDPRLAAEYLFEIGWARLSQADLSLTMSVDNPTAAPGSQVAFTLTLSNQGPNQGEEIVVTDPLPSGLTYLSHSGNGAYNPSSGQWQLDTLGTGLSEDLLIIARVEEGGIKKNTAEITATAASIGDPDSSPNNGVPGEDDMASVSIGRADLLLELSADNDRPNQGDQVVLTMTLTNQGPDTAGGIVVRNFLGASNPAPLTFQSAGGDGDYDESDGSWRVPDINEGDTAQLVITATTATSDSFSNTAELMEADLFDPDSTPGNGIEAEDDQHTLTFSPASADLSVTAAVSDDKPAVGSIVTFSFTAHNDGPDTAGGVIIETVESVGLAYDSHTGNYNPSTGVWTVGTLTSSQTLDLNYRVLEPGIHSAHAEIVASSVADPDSVPDNFDPEEDDYIIVYVQTPEADLALDLTVQNGTANPGDSVTFDLTVSNDGPDDAGGVQVTDLLPTGLTYQSHQGVGVYNPANGVWDLGNLAANASSTLSITARIDVSGTIVNEAEITAADTTDPDSTPGNGDKAEDDQDSASVGAADLSLSMSVDDDVPFVGDEIFFTLTLNNSGPEDTAGIVVSFQAPSGLSIVEPLDLVDGSWDVGALASGGQTATTVRVLVESTGAKEVRTEVFSADHTDPDSTPNNNALSEDDFDRLTVTPQSINGARIVIINADGAGEGFNDPTPTAPVGGNNGPTLGAQRINAFQHAADIWGSVLNSDVDIHMLSNFNPLTCNSGGGVLGSAGPMNVGMNFPGAPLPDTYYPQALVNAIAGTDTNGGTAEMRAQFNSSIDNNNGCLNGTNWYYGLDGNAGANIDLVTVVLHEMAHGLGFLTFVDLRSGAKFLNRNDTYMSMLEDHSSAKLWSNMSNTERFFSTLDNGDLHWVGDEVIAQSGILNSGSHSSGHVEMYAPPSLQLGSSVSHFSTSLSPNETMEPSYTVPNHDPGLALALLNDLGWTQSPRADLKLTLSASNTTPELGSQISLTAVVVNDGPGRTTGVVGNIQVPAGLNVTDVNGDGSYDDATGLWTIGSLETGADAGLQFTATVTSLDTQTMTAEVTLSNREDPDSTPGNGQNGEDDSASLNIFPFFIGTADLSLTMSVDQDEPSVGSQITLTMTVANAGPDAASNVTVTNDLPSGLTFVSSDGDYTASSGIWNVGAIPSGGSTTLNLTVTVDTAAQIISAAQISGGDQDDPDSSTGNSPSGEDDEADVTITPAPQASADLSLTMSEDIANPDVGQTVAITMTLANAGPDTATGAKILNDLPGQLSYVSHSGGTYDANTGIWAAPNLASGSSANLVINARVEISGATNVIAQVLQAQQLDPDSIPGNSNANEDDYAAIQIQPKSADLRLFLSADRPTVTEGETVDLVMTVPSAGPDAADNVTALLDLPNSLAYVSHSTVSGSYDSGSGIWTIGTISTITPTLRVTVSVNGPGNHVASAEITASDQYDPDSTPNNNNPNEDDMAFASVAVQSSGGAVITIFNNDGGGEGFNDSTAVAPIGGNDATTLGQQRLNAFQHAADIWGALINSDVEIVVRSNFDALFCSPSSAALGAAGALNVARDFNGAAFANTNYHIALANALSGVDHNGADAEITATFNSNIDNNNGCLANTNWYYGLDGQSGSDIDLVSVLLHEMGHGLGFSTFVDGRTGGRFMGKNDIYMLHLEDHSQGQQWSSMGNSGRRNSAIDTNDLHWTGSNVIGASDRLNTGVGPGGHVEMFAPNPFQAGSSVSHFSTSLGPDELMEPFYTGPNHNPGLAVNLMQDLGWGGQQLADLSLNHLMSSETELPGDTVLLTVTVSNRGPDTATGVEVLNQVGNGLVYVSHSGDGKYDSQTGLWEVGQLDELENARLLATFTIQASGDKSITSEVFGSDQVDPDSTPGNGALDEDDIDVGSIGIADLSLAMVTDNPQPTVGDQISFTVTLANDGPDSVSNLRVHAPVPPGLRFLSANTPNYSAVSGNWVPLGLAPGASTQLTLLCVVEGDAVITAELIAADENDPDSQPNNQIPAEDDQVTLIISPEQTPNADVSLTISADNGNPILGDIFTTRVSVTNDGPDDLNFLSIAVTLPAGIGFVSSTGDGSYGAGSWTLSDLSAGASAILNLALSPENLGAKTLVAQVVSASLPDPDSVPADDGGDDYGSLVIVPLVEQSDKIVILNGDAPGEGFNDPTPTAPLGGNTGSTLGRQRLIAFQHAAGIWGDLLDTTVPIVVQAQFNPLGCSPGSATLGAAGPVSAVRDFPGAELSNTYYHLALANALSSSDLNDSGSEIIAEFNANIDNNDNCLSGVNWYYGLDAEPQGNIDLVSVLLHEFAHGLGFSSLVNIVTGAKFDGRDDIYSFYLEDHSTGKRWGNMNNSERLNSMVDTGDLHWVGAETVAAGTILTAGTHPAGHVEMYAPTQLAPGSSVSHFTTAMEPNQLMEPFYTGPNHDVGISMALFRDLGWGDRSEADLSLEVGVSDASPDFGQTITLTLTLDNAGPDDGSGIEVDARLPAGLTFLSASGGYDSGTGVWTVGGLASGGQDVLTIQARVDSGAAMTFSSQVSTALIGDPDSTPGNSNPAEDDQDAVAISPTGAGVADLRLTLVLDHPNQEVGGDLALIYTLFNDGPDTATGVTVSAPLPPGLTNLQTAGDYADGIWNVGSLASGASTTLDLFVIIDSAESRVISAEVFASDQSDPDSTPNNGVEGEDDGASATLTPVFVPRADLSVEVRVNNTQPRLGDLLDYTVTVANNGPDRGTGIQVSLDVEGGLSVISTSGDGSFGDNTWSPGEIDSGAQAVLDLSVLAEAVGTFDVTAEITSALEDDPDSTPGNGTFDGPEDDRDAISVTVDDIAGGGAVISIFNADGAGEGFNDPRPTAPVGGNSGTTLGQQRLNAFQFAADIWGELLRSDVEIVVRSNYNPLPCSSGSGVLGSAGPAGIVRDFPGAEFSGTWYHMALANAQGGVDFNNSQQEIRAQFNSSIDNNNNCLFGTNWYYGLDGNTGGNIDLVTVLLHEMGHGLGFSTFVDRSTGGKLQGFDDVYMRFLEDHSTNRSWPQMTDGQRLSSRVNTGNLHFVGENLAAAVDVLNNGATGEGHVEMYAPNPFRSGSSVSHFSTSLSPNELMEPSYTGVKHDPGLAVPLFHDLGWPSQPVADLSVLVEAVEAGDDSGDQLPPTDPNLPDNAVTIAVSVTNSGPDPATGVQLAVFIGDGLDHFSHNGDGSYSVEDGRWDVGLIPSGQTAFLLINLTSQSTSNKSLFAEVSNSDMQDPDSIPNNGDPNEDDYAGVNIGVADLSLDMAVNQNPVLVGDLLTLFLTVTNNGPDDATGVSVENLLDSRFTFVSADSNYSAGTGLWRPDEINAGQSKTLSLIVRTTTAATIGNSAQIIAADQNDPDSTPDNNSPAEDDQAEISVEVNEPPPMDLDIDVTGFFTTDCPNMTLQLRVTFNDQPLGSLSANQFALFEDGVPLAFAITGVTANGEYELAFETRSPDGQSHTYHIDLAAQGTTSNNEVTAATCHISGVTQIENEQVVADLNASTGSWLLYRISVPANQGVFEAELFGGSGDADLYLKFGSEPSLEDYDYRSAEAGNNERITLEDPAGGDWYIGVRADSDFAAVSLKARYAALVTQLEITNLFPIQCPQVQAKVRVTLDGAGIAGLNNQHFTVAEDGVSQTFAVAASGTVGDYLITFNTPNPDGANHNVTIGLDIFDVSIDTSQTYANCSQSGVTELTNNQLVADFSGFRGNWIYFKINVPAGQDKLMVKMFGGSGDADLYLRRDDVPDLDNYDVRPLASGNNETAEVDNPAAGDWFIGVFGFLDFSGISLVPSYFIETLTMDLNQVSIAGCPDIRINVDVENQDGPLGGLTAANFEVVENNGTAITPTVTEDEDTEGRYDLVYTSSNNDGSDVFQTTTVSFSGNDAFVTSDYRNCTRDGGVIDVWINQDHAAPTGVETQIQVRVQPVELDFNINDVSFQVNYDDSLLVYLGLEVDGSLTQDWALVTDEGSTPGTVNIQLADAGSLALGSNEEAVLVGLRFLVNAFEGDCTQLALPEPAFSFNGGTPIARTADGGFCVSAGECPRALGDINNDGNDQQAIDALYILQMISDIPTPYDPIPVCVGDTNCSGGISVLDAVMILQKGVEIIDEYCPAEEPAALGGVFEVEIPSSDLTVELGQPFEMTVNLSQLVDDPTYGYSFDLTYDPFMIELTGEISREGSLTERWQEPVISSTPGKLTVTNVYPLAPLEDTGMLLRISGVGGSIITGQTELTFTRFALAANGEPEASFGPFIVNVEGEPCFDVPEYRTKVANWPVPETILTLIDFISCLDTP